MTFPILLDPFSPGDFTICRRDVKETQGHVTPYSHWFKIITVASVRNVTILKLYLTINVVKTVAINNITKSSYGELNLPFIFMLYFLD